MTENKEDDLLVVGRTNGAYGVRGSVRVIPFEGGEVLATARHWFIRSIRGDVKEVAVKNIKMHGTVLLAQFEGVDTKEAADALRGHICVTREDFPEPEEGEFWAVDVIGCRVVNKEGVYLGNVTDVGTNTVQDIFKVEGGPKIDGKDAVYLIPDVESYVLEIDLETETVTVDWQPEWI